MKFKICSLIILLSALNIQLSFAQCTETNAAGCSCPTPGSTNCLLLPDILAGKKTLNSTRGWTEYNQMISDVNKGLLRLDVSTPNVGWGPLQVSPTDDYVCGLDTLRGFFPPPNFLCPDGSYPKRLIKQKLYNKVGNNFQFILRDAGWMQFHPSHGHIHIEGWGLYTLRLKDASIADTLKWPIVNSGVKVSFCLIDLTTCSGALGDCVDANGNVLNNASFPNYALGGGYSCGATRQGISVGKVDIYGQYLDESFVKIPYEACNGNYYVMIQVDPDNHFLEMNEDNNWLSAAVPLQKQRTSNTGAYAYIFSKKGNILCTEETMELEASGASSYLWSNGATTQKTTIGQAGKYWVRATTPCGTTTSDTLNIIAAPASSIPVITKEDTICTGEKANLYASGNAHWFDAATNGNLIFIGNNFQTGSLAANTTFYVADQPSLLTGSIGPESPNFSNTGNFAAAKSDYLIFNSFIPFKLKKVTVNAATAGTRIVELRTMYGKLMMAKQVVLVAGIQEINLDFFVPAGMNLQLGLKSNSPLTGLFTSSTANANIGYPFNLESVGRIVGSSLGDQFYPFFYNWQIEGTPQVCNAGTRKAVTAYVTQKANIGINGLADNYLHTDKAVIFTITPPGVILAAGPGIINNEFHPKLAGVGIHQFNCTYRYGNCVTNFSKIVSVNFNDAVMDDGFSIQLWNNPGKNQKLYLVTNQNSAVDIRLLSSSGQKVMQLELNAVNGSNIFNLDFSNLARGVYFIEVTLKVNNAKKMIKLIN
ncbi:MAG: T9SS type A sorting domain-containing protein [Chitinophagaceae bacterium]|nr:T9SS type A sorting domain-containing protein [Chitinophagaceae bacterium]